MICCGLIQSVKEILGAVLRARNSFEAVLLETDMVSLLELLKSSKKPSAPSENLVNLHGTGNMEV